MCVGQRADRGVGREGGRKKIGMEWHGTVLPRREEKGNGNG